MPGSPYCNNIQHQELTRIQHKKHSAIHFVVMNKTYRRNRPTSTWMRSPFWENDNLSFICTYIHMYSCVCRYFRDLWELTACQISLVPHSIIHRITTIQFGVLAIMFSLFWDFIRNGFNRQALWKCNLNLTEIEQIVWRS